MKNVFVIQTQHDGLMNAGFTNIKALHTFLISELNIVTALIDGKKFNYANLAAEIKKAQKANRFTVAFIEDSEIGEITISELGILSK